MLFPISFLPEFGEYYFLKFLLIRYYVVSALSPLKSIEGNIASPILNIVSTITT